MIGLADLLSDLLGQARVASPERRAVLLAEAHASIGAARRRGTIAREEADALVLEVDRMAREVES